MEIFICLTGLELFSLENVVSEGVPDGLLLLGVKVWAFSTLGCTIFQNIYFKLLFQLKSYFKLIRHIFQSFIVSGKSTVLQDWSAIFCS